MESPFKVRIFTPIWGRPEIVKIWAKGVKRLQKYWPEAIEIDVFCVVSTEEDRDLIQSLGFKWGWAENKPLGKKHNDGLEYVKNGDWEYILQLGSDDLLSNEYLHYALYAMQSGLDFFGVDAIYFADSETKKACEFKLSTQAAKLIGAGRFISHKALASVDYRPWPNEISKGLDMTSQALLESKGYKPTVLKTSEICVLDVKSSVNIWSFDRFAKFNPSVDWSRIETFFE